ncbi:RNase HII [Keratinibaculum paraultunense]|uniref:Ribonuclease HII n=1 Tax=Keratinibaculum paraultunense TaxID=1278232 RepID=A0A4R3KVI2_9FIRM|nr:ribonuclease HII [Keratinibaculum paraultunense]QQY80751.1 ribonuclease HII [Keratinibaculum paraultunense]TCS89639.1 RNase HII [Keratinibaculum paraultunense]
MLDIENKLHNEGYKLIACIDEVGRGCLAGDVIACAIIMPEGLMINGVDDSKKLTAKKREKLYYDIIENSIAVGIGQVDSKIIDEINIKESAKLAMKKAVLNLKDKNNEQVIPDYLLIDAERVSLDIPQTSLIKGDAKSHGIACASIIAKVYRDRLCQIWDKQFPGYKINKNKGYGTKEHREAIKQIGPSPIHRISFLGNILSK